MHNAKVNDLSPYQISHAGSNGSFVISIKPKTKEKIFARRPYLLLHSTENYLKIELSFTIITIIPNTNWRSCRSHLTNVRIRHAVNIDYREFNIVGSFSGIMCISSTVKIGQKFKTEHRQTDAPTIW
jgi:hypothetical protein